MDLPDRFFDLDQEFLQKLPFSIDYRNQPLVTIDEAIGKLQMSRQNIDHMMKLAKWKGLRLKYKLTVDEAAAIYLYTMRHSEPDRDISIQLNKALRLRFRQMLTSWYSYLQLLITALNKLPSMKGTIWRYARGHVADNYQTDCIWSGFSSCTGTKPLFEQPFNEYDVYSIFQIECMNGKVIRDFSECPWDNEVILLPDTYLRVVKKLQLKNTLTIVYLQEQGSPHLLMIPPLSFSSSKHKKRTAKHGLASNRSQLHSETISVQSSNSPKLPLIKPVSPPPTNRSQASPMERKQSNKNNKDTTSTNAKAEFTEKKHQHSPVDKSWLGLNFHDDSKRAIVTPEDLEIKLQDPPKIVNDSLLNRVKGSMFGMAIGDALAVHARFRSHQDLLQHPVQDFQEGGRWNLKKGQFADDTSMGLCLASSLVVRRDFIPFDQLVRYKWWFRHGYMSSTGQCFTVSSIMSQSLKEFERRQQLFISKHKIPSAELDTVSDAHLLQDFDIHCSNSDIAGNETLMRLAPVPLFFYRHPNNAIEFSGISGTITHSDSTAYDSCRYYSALIVAALRGETKQQLLDDKFYLNHKSWFNNKPLGSDVMKIVEGSYKKLDRNHAGIEGNERIINALEAALWAFYYDEDSFEKGILKAINLGDDTDTTAAIYGPLAGTYYGFENLPKKWISQVYARDFITCISKWIVYEGELWQPNLHNHLMIPLQFPNTQNSTSVVDSGHMQVSDRTHKEQASSKPRVQELKRPSPVPAYVNSLRLQRIISPRVETTPGMYDYDNGTRYTIGEMLNSTYHVRTPSRHEGTSRYRPSDPIGFSYGSNMLPSDSFISRVNSINRRYPPLSDWSQSWHPSISPPSTPYYYSRTRGFHEFY